MKPLVAIISNPGSTTNRATLPAIRTFIEKNSSILHVEIDRFEEIEEALHMCARAKPSVLVINGGDGTIQATLSAMVHHSPFGDTAPPIAVLPGGKTNMIAKDLGMRGSNLKALSRIYKLTMAGEIEKYRIRRALIGLDVGDGRPKAYGMFFGAAGIISGIEACRAHIYPLKLPDIVSHLATTAMIFFGVIVQGNSEKSVVHAPLTRVQVKSGGYIDGRFLAVMVTTLDRLIMGIDPFTKMGKGALKFTAIEHSRMTFFKAMIALIFGRLGKAVISGVHYRRSDIVRLETDDVVTLDGEMYKASKGQGIVLDGTSSLDFIGL